MKMLEKFQQFSLTTNELKSLKGGNCGCIDGAEAACQAAGYTGDWLITCTTETIVECISVFPHSCHPE